MYFANNTHCCQTIVYIMYVALASPIGSCKQNRHAVDTTVGSNSSCFSWKHIPFILHEKNKGVCLLLKCTAHVPLTCILPTKGAKKSVEDSSTAFRPCLTTFMVDSASRSVSSLSTRAKSERYREAKSIFANVLSRWWGTVLQQHHSSVHVHGYQVHMYILGPGLGMV